MAQGTIFTLLFVDCVVARKGFNQNNWKTSSSLLTLLSKRILRNLELSLGKGPVMGILKARFRIYTRGMKTSISNCFCIKLLPTELNKILKIVSFTDGHHRTSNNVSRGANIKTPTSPVPTALKANKEYVRHKVDYLGALPISASRSTNLAALQRPLKELYFKWRALRNLGHSNLPGTLEINDTGLTVQYIRELHKGVQVIKQKYLKASSASRVLLSNLMSFSFCRKFSILFQPLPFGRR